MNLLQKLLARTQARKNQLVKKREELEACRAKRNSPIKDRSRRPLSEDNTDSGSEIDTDDVKRRRIGSEDGGENAILKNSKKTDVDSPSVQVHAKMSIIHLVIQMYVKTDINKIVFYITKPANNILSLDN